MFESLSQRLENAWRRLRGGGRLTPQDVDAALREVRLALLEADVHFRVVKDFVARIRERAVADDVLGHLTPQQQIIKIVHDELCTLMGSESARLAMSNRPPTVVLLCGLQGAGKTTFAAKLAGWLQGQGRRPLLVAADLQRPAAVEQLQINARQVGVPVVAPEPGEGPADVAARGLARAAAVPADVVVIDTAGRSQADAELMEELRAVRARVHPHEVLLVLDALAGQDAVQVARGFVDGVGVDGVVLTRLDSDARGGAALSVRAVTGRPIKFVGTGERLDAIEPFHPERMASRILGMGDVLSLIERAEAAVDHEQAERMRQRVQRDGLTLEDFLEQMQTVRRMGPLEQILGMIPGLGGKLRSAGAPQVDERELVRVEAIIRSMTGQERRHPDILDASRKQRVARGSGTSVQEVNRLLRQFGEVRRLLRTLSQGRMPPGLGGAGLAGLGGGAGGMPGLPSGMAGLQGMPGLPGVPGGAAQRPPRQHGKRGRRHRHRRG